MPVKLGELRVGDFIFLDDPGVPNFLNRRWIEVEGFTQSGKPTAFIPRMGKPNSASTERSFMLDSIALYKTKAVVETEYPRIVSLQAMLREQREEWIKNLNASRQTRIQELVGEQRLPHYDVVRKVILKNMDFVQETGYMRVNREVVEELASLFRRGD